MIPGPDKLIECPNCKALARVFTLLSGNTFGAKRWTDGKIFAPMLPRPPAITKCRNCGRYFWLSDAKVIGELLLWEPEAEKIPSEWKAAEPVRELSEAEYIEAIKIGMAHNREQELYLRIHAWWASNDRLRFNQDAGEQAQTIFKHSAEAIMNLERLLNLLDITDPDERLMKAEILRELGRFDEAIQLLEFDFPSKYTSIVTLIRDLARRKDSLVREIPENSSEAI
jgi:hypothetical protein